MTKVDAISNTHTRTLKYGLVVLDVRILCCWSSVTLRVPCRVAWLRYAADKAYNPSVRPQYRPHVAVPQPSDIPLLRDGRRLRALPRHLPNGDLPPATRRVPGVGGGPRLHPQRHLVRHGLGGGNDGVGNPGLFVSATPTWPPTTQ